MHGLGSQFPVKLNRWFVPIENSPFHSATAAFARDFGEIDQQRLSMSFAPMFRLHEQVFEVQPGPAQPGREVMKKDGESDCRLPLERQSNLRRRLLTEKNLQQAFLRSNDIVRGAFISGQVPNQLQDQRHISGTGRSNAEWVLRFFHRAQTWLNRSSAASSLLQVREVDCASDQRPSWKIS